MPPAPKDHKGHIGRKLSLSLDLEAYFIRFDNLKQWTQVDRLHDASGVHFLCPKCFNFNNGPIGTHSCICWFKDRGVPDEMDPKPGRWVPGGTGLNDLTFIGPGSVSILLTGGCGWHGYCRDGNIESDK